MNVEIIHRPSYSLAVVQLAPNERIRADAGAMVSMTDGITIETKAAGGILKSLTRSVLGGESFFQNFFQAPAQGGEITLAPDLPGDMVLIELSNRNIMIQAGSYVASEIGVDLNAKISKKAFLSAEGISILEASGNGKVLVSSYGAIYERELSAGEKYIVDTSHLVAFDGTIDVQVRTVGGLKSTLLSGEGLVVQVTGPGKLWMQTRSPSALINWIIPHIPKKD
ncbi:MAG: TIGR00266 family protein [Anaerolineales bacterium]